MFLGLSLPHLPVRIISYSGGGCKWAQDHFRFLVRVNSCVIFNTARFSSIVVFVDSVERLSPINLLLQHFSDEREDEERENRAPDEGINDHQHPPENAAGGCADGIGDDVARLAKETLENQEADEMRHAQRHISE